MRTSAGHLVEPRTYHERIAVNSAFSARDASDTADVRSAGRIRARVVVRTSTALHWQGLLERGRASASFVGIMFSQVSVASPVLASRASGSNLGPASGRVCRDMSSRVRGAVRAHAAAGRAAVAEDQQPRGAPRRRIHLLARLARVVAAVDGVAGLADRALAHGDRGHGGGRGRRTGRTRQRASHDRPHGGGAGDLFDGCQRHHHRRAVIAGDRHNRGSRRRRRCTLPSSSLQLPAVLEWLKAFRPSISVVGAQLRAGGPLQYPTIASMYSK